MITRIPETAIYLASCAVNEVKPDADKIAGIDFEKIFSFASYHVMGAVVGMAIESAGVKNDHVKNAISFSVRKNTFFEAANNSVLRKLEEAGIWYMPLKGAVLKNYYPRFGMREMSDHDILFDATRAEDVKRIMESLSFTTKYFGTGNHDIYYKEPLCNFEMHRGLFGSFYNEKFYEYYAEVKSRLIKDDGNNYGYHFSPEDFYVYMTAHEYKHYSVGGTGLRSLLDVYVFLKKSEGLLDFDYVLSEMEKLELSEFEEKNRCLALNLFGNNEITGDNREMLEYVVHSGAYGNVENSVRNRLKKYGGGGLGKIRYVLSKLFPPVNSMKSTYHKLREHEIYYPALIVFRLLKAITLNWRKVLRELLILWKS